jgi:hypothetical protein
MREIIGRGRLRDIEARDPGVLEDARPGRDRRPSQAERVAVGMQVAAIRVVQRAAERSLATRVRSSSRPMSRSEW